MDLLMAARHLWEACETIDAAQDLVVKARSIMDEDVTGKTANGVGLEDLQAEIRDHVVTLGKAYRILDSVTTDALQAAGFGKERDPRLFAVCPACEGTCEAPFEDHARVSMEGTEHYTTGGGPCPCCKGEGTVSVDEWLPEGSITTRHQEDGVCCAEED